MKQKVMLNQILVGNEAIETPDERKADIALCSLGERIVVNELPFYIGQTIVDRKNPERFGTLKGVVISARSDVPVFHCLFDDVSKSIPLSECGMPVMNFERLEQKGFDDFFDCLQIGDAIDVEVAESLFSMTPPLVSNEDYFQSSGKIGVCEETDAGRIPLYLTVKKFGSILSPWRYIGHCAKNDDIHIEHERG